MAAKVPMRYVEAPKKKKPDKYPLFKTDGMSELEADLDRQAALVVNLLKSKMITRPQIKESIEEIKIEHDREFYRSRINEYLKFWSER